MVVATFALGATPAFSDSVFEAMQCKLVGDKTEDDVIAGAGKWLAAARTMKGGEDLRLSIHFPVAGGHPETDFIFVLRAPSFETWGRFWDGYPGSPADKLDGKATGITECASGRLYGGVEIKPE
jgi:hypothetical protein